jgi:hypothetical protein
LAKKRRRIASARDNARIKKQKLKDARHGLAILKKKGLYDGPVRDAQLTPKVKRVLSRNKDVISGQSVVGKIISFFKQIFVGGQRTTVGHKVKTEFEGRARTYKGHIIVPKPAGGKGIVRYNRKSGKLVTYSIVNGKRVESKILPTNADWAAIQASPGRKEWTINLKNNAIRHTWSNYEDLVDYMSGYEHEGGIWATGEWTKYVRVKEVRANA